MAEAGEKCNRLPARSSNYRPYGYRRRIARPYPPPTLEDAYEFLGSHFEGALKKWDYPYSPLLPPLQKGEAPKPEGALGGRRRGGQYH